MKIANLKEIVSRQKDIAADLEAECRNLEESDFIKENAALKTEIEKIRAEIEKLNNSSAELASEIQV
jgi:dynactin complex subunit